MKRLGFILLLLIMISGCVNKSNPKTEEAPLLTGDGPPPVSIEVAGKLYPTVLGGYCWTFTEEGMMECTDAAGPLEALANADPVTVSAGEPITFVMDYEPLPNRTYLTRVEANDTYSTDLKDHTFIAPDELGIYFYSYDVSWMDEIDVRISHADASYMFVIEVE